MGCSSPFDEAPEPVSATQDSRAATEQAVESVEAEEEAPQRVTLSGQFESLDAHCDDRKADLERLLSTGEVTWPNIYDGRGGDVASEWMIEELPTTFVVDREGVIRHIGIGDSDNAAIAQSVLEENLFVPKEDLVSRNAVWLWSDSSDTPPRDWMNPGYDDRKWNKGNAPFGDGRPQIATPLGYKDLHNKTSVVHFRRNVMVHDSSGVRQ